MTTPHTLPAARTAVVTGAGRPSGIAAATGATLLTGGWSVALVDVNADGVQQVAEQLTQQHKDSAGTVLPLAADITDEAAVTELFDRVDAELPPVLGLVNLAGIASPLALHESDLATFERVMRVNVTGSYLMLRAAAKRMLQHGIGRIVNTSSITAFDGGGTFSKGIYATAKAAVVGMCKGAARELGPHGITVNVIAPGAVDTEIMGGKLTDERKAGMAQSIPLGRVARTDEIAAVFGFLLSDAGSYLNGSTLQVDGGKLLH